MPPVRVTGAPRICCHCCVRALAVARRVGTADCMCLLTLKDCFGGVLASAGLFGVILWCWGACGVGRAGDSLQRLTAKMLLCVFPRYHRVFSGYYCVLPRHYRVCAQDTTVCTMKMLLCVFCWISAEACAKILRCVLSLISAGASAKILLCVFL